jgi:hypothetical protein
VGLSRRYTVILRDKKEAEHTMTTTREQKKAEAVARMKMLNIIGKAREEFRRSNKLNKSEPCKMFGTTIGALYWLNDEEKAEVKAFEEEYNVLVYHVIHNITKDGGVWDSYLYVDDDSETWEQDRADIRAGYTFAYVNTHDFCAEFGTIGIKPAGGGVVRTA